MNKIKLMIKKYREIIMYIFIGGCTTLVNLVTYTAMYKLLDFSINISNITSIVVAIIFAYFTNKIFVFDSKDNTFKTLFSEGIKFISARLFTMLIEVYGVYLLVVINGENEFLGKIKVQVIILVLNYVMSKFIVFKK
ncbi:GtrA family protein [Romboutsia lituseburensis]|uniref:Putative flippase GtrA (Transmembrane translocase of bactoprenol-linked glucose) n=1 Tax=Romboutsia lituseburensis DSM 797 TaxID=1121325 RepID=A0A1G9KA68_9FIRM|nr:GtrA family protein [Romboutsia lituseburensis]CEH34830.1 GtrA-like protein [Romboutsia lituseburensis]SDL46668.1 Putative flippase GtrA (transmembrane translocase of bactoprenol-linked glucose) [Romboutsia lituseburensis DSM 797]